MTWTEFFKQKIFLRISKSAPLLLFVFIVVGVVSAQHDVYLETPNTVPSYCQEANNWCGAATGQMILEGYPGGTEHPFTQTHVWNRIVFHRDDPGASWATDPDGLRETLMELGGDPGVNWSIYANSNPQSLMYSITYWMTRRSFPTAVLVNPGGSPYGSFQHWVMIDGFTTDVDPTTNSSVTLNFIEIVDPWNPPCPTATHGGIRSLVSGATWYGSYWDVPGNYPASKWHGNYVAVIEPPLQEGVAKARKQVEQGKIISEAMAQEFAMRWFKELKLEERAQYEVLRGSIPLKPLLVNQEFKGYYLVPLGQRVGELSQGAILLNAYNGEFQEVGVFQKPFKYLDKDRAVKLALNYLCACRKEVKDVRAQMLFKSCEQTQVRFIPVWQVTVDRVTVYVTQQEKVFDKLTPLLPGD